MAKVNFHPSWLKSQSRQNLPWWKILAELIDNSFDAAARNVVMTFDKNALVIRDDGNGIKDLAAIVDFGGHIHQETTSLGFYGVGLKDAWLFCSDTMEVESIHRKRLGKMKINVAELDRNKWNFDNPTYAKTTKPPFTQFRFPLRDGKNTPSRQVYDEIAWRFTPALESGCSIVHYNGRVNRPLNPMSLPKLSDVVAEQFVVNGKDVSIEIGMLPEGVSMSRGPFWLIFGHRIVEQTAIGAGSFSVQRVGGKIILGKGWELTKNKDGLAESRDSIEALSDAIFIRIKGLMAKVSEQAESIAIDAFKSEVEILLNTAAINMLEKKKQKRPGPRGKKSGTVTPKGTGRKHKKAKSVSDEPGNVVLTGTTAAGRKRGFVLDYASMDPNLLGKFDRNSLRVTLNESHQFIERALKEKNKQCLALCGFTLIADEDVRLDDRNNSLMAFQCESFSAAIGVLAAGMVDGGSNVQAAS